MGPSEPEHPAAGRPLLRRLQQRLNELIAAHYPDERKRPGYARLAKEIRDVTGGTISGTYLWELATGKKRNVTLEQLDILASFFGVPPEYFLNDDVAERVNTQLALASALRDVRVRNLAMRAEGLSPASLDALLTMVNEARKMQQLSSAGSAAGDATRGAVESGSAEGPLDVGVPRDREEVRTDGSGDPRHPGGPGSEDDHRSGTAI